MGALRRREGSGSGLIVIETQNSTYEIDTNAKLARRVRGVNEPTPNLGEDGKWHLYVSVSLATVGDSLVIEWGKGKATITSAVKLIASKS